MGQAHGISQCKICIDWETGKLDQLKIQSNARLTDLDRTHQTIDDLDYWSMAPHAALTHSQTTYLLRHYVQVHNCHSGAIPLKLHVISNMLVWRTFGEHRHPNWSQVLWNVNLNNIHPFKGNLCSVKCESQRTSIWITMNLAYMYSLVCMLLILLAPLSQQISQAWKLGTSLPQWAPQTNSSTLSQSNILNLKCTTM